jgi:hypothetical protein
MRAPWLVLSLIAAVFCASPYARADLTGTVMNITVSHGWSVNFDYTYGSTQVVPLPFNPSFTFTVSSPAPLAGLDNSIRFNFVGLGYGDYAGQTGSLSITSIDEDVLPGSPSLFHGFGGSIGSASGSGDSITATWPVSSVLDRGSAEVLIGWDSVPAPPAAALLLIGALRMPRRRR